MDAVITPNRSLSRRGFYWLIGVLIAFNALVATLMFALGAWPAPPFLLLDVVGVFIAFQVSNRRARQAERVRVSADAVTVSHEMGARARTVWYEEFADTIELFSAGRRAKPGGIATVHDSGAERALVADLAR